MSRTSRLLLAVAVTSSMLFAPSGVATAGAADDRTHATAPRRDFDALERAARADGAVRALVGLRTTFSAQAPPGDSEHARARDDVLRAVRDTGSAVVHAYEAVPYVALRLTPAGVRALRDSGKAASVARDIPEAPSLDQTSRIVEATEAATLARSGAGRSVAVLDTGVDAVHPFFRGAGGRSRVIAEECFSAHASCPNGRAHQSGAGAAAPCSYQPGVCDHGTHIAGIAVGRGAAFSGVARDANLVAVQVYSRFRGSSCPDGAGPCALAYVSDQIKGLERVYLMRNHWHVAAVNMSLGGSLVQGACDDDPRKDVIDRLRAAGIATVISSGNSGAIGSVTRPGCISSAVTVGATQDDDAVAWFTNSSRLLDALAPGVDVRSSVSGGGFAFGSGTSMAAPHVAGAWAVARAVAPGASHEDVLRALQSTGRIVRVPGSELRVPRVRVLSATAMLADTGFRPLVELDLEGGGLVSNGVGLARRLGGPASGDIAIGGIPQGALVRAAVLVWSTIGGPDDSVVFEGTRRRGRLAGASRQACWPSFHGAANRTYTLRLGPGEVPGNGRYSISGVDGHGASLVVAYERPGSPDKVTAVVEAGARTLVPPGIAAEVLDGLDVPVAPSRVRLHLGVGDGESAKADGPVLVQGAAVTSADLFDGSDGAGWDDETIVLQPSNLPYGTTSRQVALRGGGDCLAWAWAGLVYTPGAQAAPW